jgi:predicted lipoprotein with Yx(FWY)xxD motif
MVDGLSPILARLAGAVAAVLIALYCVAAGDSAINGVVVSSARNGALGGIQILVNAKGRTLYRSSLHACTGSCAVEWPPLLVPASSKLRAGSDVSTALLGRVKRSGGRWQVTYRGTPLYLFSGDTRAGQANGQGLDGVWHVITAGGVTVMKSASATSSESTSSSSGSQGTSSPPMTTTTGSGSTGSEAGSSANPGMFCAANPKSCVNGVPVTGATTTTASSG